MNSTHVIDFICYSSRSAANGSYQKYIINTHEQMHYFTIAREITQVQVRDRFFQSKFSYASIQIFMPYTSSLFEPVQCFLKVKAISFTIIQIDTIENLLVDLSTQCPIQQRIVIVNLNYTLIHYNH